MVFKSKVDGLNGSIIALTCILLIGAMIYSWFQEPLYISQTIWLNLFLLSVVILLVWIVKSTYYIVEDETLHYHSGPFRGNVNLKEIYRLEINKTLWMSNHPATSMRGIIVRYKKYDEIYISPKDKEGFVKACLAVNPDIEVKYY